MVREGQVVEADTLSELGIFGYLVRRGDKVLHNKGAGHMMRTKVSSHTASADQPCILPAFMAGAYVNV